MPRACDAGGAEWYDTSIDTTMSRPAISRLCQRPSVSDSGITPLIRSIASGSDAGAAMISAADEDRPSAHTLPTPRYAAAPTAR
jgi:hypothetical protein